MSISVATMGKFDFQIVGGINNIGGGIIQEEIEIKKPNIFVKFINDIPLDEKLQMNANINYNLKPNIKVQII